jgi:hypothetical protein
MRVRLRLLLPVFALVAVASSALEDPMTLTAAADTTLIPTKAGDPGRDPGSEIDMMIYGPDHANKDYRGLLQFDLKDLPKTPLVQCAVLKLTVYKMFSVRKTKQDIIRVHRVVRPWRELEASWGRSLKDDEWINKGGDFDPMPAAATPLLDSQTGEASGKTIEFDVTPLVQQWQSGQQPNYGMILINSDNESKTTARPYSRNDTNDGNRPKLVLHWASAPKRDPNWIKPGTLKPLGPPVQMKIVFNPSLQQGRVGQKFDDTLKASGGIAPYTFKITGELPEGLTATPEGRIQGSPVKAGKHPLTISISDAGKRSGSGKVEIVVVEPDKAAAAPEAKKDEAKKDKPKDEE